MLQKAKVLQDHIDEIMDYFDFNKVHQAMVALDWKWSIDGEFRVPMVYELRKTVRRLIKEANEKWDKEVYVSSGGFEIKINRQEGTEIKISFVIEDYITSNY